MTVYVPRSSARSNGVYHTNKKCRRLRAVIPRDEDQIPDDWTECEWCSGDVELGGPEGPTLASKLLEASD